MRTTVTFDQDVAAILRPLLANGEPQVVMNDLLRIALGIKRKIIVDLPVFDLRLTPGIDPAGPNNPDDTLFE